MKGKVVVLFGLSICLVLLVGLYVLSDGNMELSQAKEVIPESDDKVREVNGIEIAMNDFYLELEANEQGKQYMIVDLSFTNNRETVYEFSPFNLTLVDEEGFAHSMNTSIETKGILGGQLHPGRTNRGEVAFLVPIASQYELVYTDHLRTGQVTWQVTIDKE
jgi:predicted small secreted protein